MKECAVCHQRLRSRWRAVAFVFKIRDPKSIAETGEFEAGSVICSRSHRVLRFAKCCASWTAEHLHEMPCGQADKFPGGGAHCAQDGHAVECCKSLAGAR